MRTLRKKAVEPNKAPSNYQRYAVYSGLAFQLFALIGLGVWGGLSLDRYFSLSFPAFTVLFSLSACVGAMVMLIRSLTK